jgi:hypothetical protein
VDRRSVIIAGSLLVGLAAIIGVAFALGGGGGGGSVQTGSGATTTSVASTPLPSTTTTTTSRLPPPSFVPTTPTTVVITPPPSTTPTTTPNGASDVGITAHTIRVTVVADTAPVVKGVQAWAATVNESGGLAGRTVKVDARVVSNPSEYSAAITNACTTSFAVVGSSSQFDSQSSGLACGVPEVATHIFDPAHQSRAASYAVIPARAGVVPVGAFRHLLSTVTGCCSQYVLVPTVGPARAATQAVVQAAAAVGFTTAGTPDVPPGAGPAEYTKLVADLVSKQATFASSGLGAESTVRLRKAAAANPAAGVVKVWYCDATCGEQSFLTSGGPAVDGENVALGVNPLADEARIPTMAAYVRVVKTLGPPTVAGLESYSAGLLFQQAAHQVVAASGPNGLTRVRLLAALGTVHTFTAGGILGTTDVGARQPTGCYVLLRVDGGRFVRVFPSAPAQLDCGAQNLQTVSTGG